VMPVCAAVCLRFRHPGLGIARRPILGFHGLNASLMRVWARVSAMTALNSPHEFRDVFRSHIGYAVDVDVVSLSRIHKRMAPFGCLLLDVRRSRRCGLATMLRFGSNKDCRSTMRTVAVQSRYGDFARDVRYERCRRVIGQCSSCYGEAWRWCDEIAAWHCESSEF